MMPAAALPKRKRRARRPVAEERVGATIETAAKLTEDPLFRILALYGRGDAALERAAGEIKAIYGAVCKGLFKRGHALGERLGNAKAEMPDTLAKAHAERYLPWANANHPRVVDATLRVVWDRDDVPTIYYQPVAAALADYARRMR